MPTITISRLHLNATVRPSIEVSIRAKEPKVQHTKSRIKDCLSIAVLSVAIVIGFAKLPNTAVASQQEVNTTVEQEAIVANK